MVLRIVVDILIAFFAVFGVYAALRLVLALFLSPAGLGVALEITTKEDAENVDLLLLAAKENFYLRSNGTLIALVDDSLAGNRELIEKLEAKHAKIHYVRTKDHSA